jgi:hypothetical protein
MMKKYLGALSIGTLVLATIACTSKNTLDVSRSNISVGTNTFNGKNVGIDLSGQVDTIHTSMGGGKFEFANAKSTVQTFFKTALKDRAKTVKDGRSDITIKPILNIDMVNDYFTQACLAKIDLTLVNAKGEQIKTVSKNFKKSYYNSGFGSPQRKACNEAVTEVMAVALNSL